jgi:uncharacterized protein DUF2017
MALLGPIRRLPGGGVRVRLTVRERDLLASLPAQLRPLLAGDHDLDTPAGPVRRRLFPAAYDDPLDELEYQELVSVQLSSDRLAAVEDFARTLEGGSVRRSWWSRELDAEQAAAWLSALNDARLTLAMVVGVTHEDDWQRGPDRSDPTSVALYYLGWLQDQLLGALMRSLPDDED